MNTALPTIKSTVTATVAIPGSRRETELQALATRKGVLESKQAGWEFALSAALLITAVAGLMIFFFDWRLRKASKAIQEVQNDIIRIKDTDVANAQKAAAEAQLATTKYLAVVAKSVNPRHLDRKRFIELLEGTPKGTAEILYESDNDEAKFFALDIYRWLGQEGVGWTVTIKPFPRKREAVDPRYDIRVAARSSGLAIVANHIPTFDPTSPAQKLRNAIDLGAGGWGISGASFAFENLNLPDHHFVVAVGQHQTNLAIWQPNPQQ